MRRGIHTLAFLMLGCTLACVGQVDGGPPPSPLRGDEGLGGEPDDGGDEPEPKEEPECLHVAGSCLQGNEDQWVRYIGRNVVNRLPGSRSKQLEDAATVTWWSLKEGVLALDNAPGWSLCGLERLGALGVCSAGVAWQVGIAGAQVPGMNLGELEGMARDLDDGDVRAALEEAADDAGFRSQESSIVSNSGTLRISWLLRHAVIGFRIQIPIVTRECVNGSLYWCYGSDWPQTARYAPDHGTGDTVRRELYKVLGEIAP